MLGKKVAIALCGATGAGTVVGLSFDGVQGTTASAGEAQIDSIKGCAPLFRADSEGSDAAESFSVSDFGTADGARPDLSVLVVNTVAGESQQVELAHEIVSLIPADSSVVVMASAHLGSKKGTVGHVGGLQVAALNGFELPEALSKAPALPGSTQLQDGVLAALTHFLIASGTPTCCLLCQGSTSPAGMGQGEQPWLAEAKTLGEAAAAALGESSAKVVHERLSRWTAAYRIDHLHSKDQGKDLAGGDLMYV